MRKSLFALLLAGWTAIGQAQVQLRDSYPQHYRVQPGDTLWSVASLYLQQPWQWRELWPAGFAGQIFPGDRLQLVRNDGPPRLQLERPAAPPTVKLAPQARRLPPAPIPSIPLQAISSFLLDNRIVDQPGALEQAPYIVAGEGERVLGGMGDRLFARGRLDPEQPVYELFRQGKIYRDPLSQELLGVNADAIGSARVVASEGDLATLTLQSSNQEVRLGDRLLAADTSGLPSSFSPSAPQRPVEGLIIDVPRGVTQIGALDVVTLNRGRRDGLLEGNVLAVIKTGETVRDRQTGEPLKIPDEAAGWLMVFRSYDRLSYGLVLKATRSLAVLDKVRNP